MRRGVKAKGSIFRGSHRAANEHSNGSLAMQWYQATASASIIVLVLAQGNPKRSALRKATSCEGKVSNVHPELELELLPGKWKPTRI